MEVRRTLGLVDQILLASWIAVYAGLLFGFECLKRLERRFERQKRSLAMEAKNEPSNLAKTQR